MTPGIGNIAIVSATYNGTSSTMRLNGGVASTGDVGNANPGGFSLGASGTAGLFSSAIDVGEFIIYNSDLSDQDEDAIFEYLNDKWNIY